MGAMPFSLVAPAWPGIIGQAVGTGPSYSAEATQFFARLVTAPTSGQKDAYAAFIDGLKADGIWVKLDALWIARAISEVNARVNLVQDAFPLNRYGSLNFQTDFTGIKGTGGSNDYYIAQFDITGTTNEAAINLSQNSASAGGYMASGPAGASLLDAGSKFYIWPNADPQIEWHGCSTTNSVGVTTATSGMFGFSRTGATTNVAYYNGVQDSAKTDSSSSLVGSVSLGRYGGGNTFATTCKWEMAWLGGGFTATDHANLTSRYGAFRTAIAGQTGVSATVTLGSNSATIISNGRSNWMGGLEKLSNGNLFCCYLSTPGGVGVAGSEWRYQITSTPTSWSGTETTLSTGDGTRVPCNIEAKVLANNTIFVVGDYQKTTGGDDLIVTYIGAADASSFSSATTIDCSSVFPNKDVRMACKPLILDNGNVVVAVYGQATGDAVNTTSVALLFFTATGTVIGSPILVLRAIGSQPFNEAGLFQDDVTGQIVIIVRSDNEATYWGYYRMTCDRDGSNPSAANRVIKQSRSVGKPAIIKTAPNRIVMWSRANLFGQLTQWGWSEDGGKVWTPMNRYGSGSAAPLQYVYASSCLLDTNTIASAIGIATGVGSASDLKYQELKQ